MSLSHLDFFFFFVDDVFELLPIFEIAGSTLIDSSCFSEVSVFMRLNLKLIQRSKPNPAKFPPKNVTQRFHKNTYFSPISGVNIFEKKTDDRTNANIKTIVLIIVLMTRFTASV